MDRFLMTENKHNSKLHFGLAIMKLRRPGILGVLGIGVWISRVLFSLHLCTMWQNTAEVPTHGQVTAPSVHACCEKCGNDEAGCYCTVPNQTTSCGDLYSGLHSSFWWLTATEFKPVVSVSLPNSGTPYFSLLHLFFQGMYASLYIFSLSKPEHPHCCF